jgi:hypothetical protein
MVLSAKTARWHFVRECVAAMAIICVAVTGVLADEAAKDSTASSSKATPCGEVDFDCPGLPDASIEVDLSQGMFKDLFGLGDALISGAVDGLVKAVSGKKDDSEEAHATAEELQAARQIVQLAGQVVKGVRVREYDEGAPLAIKEVAAHFSAKLKAQNWETVVRVRSEDELYVVNVLRVDGAIKGLFLIVHDDDSTVLANIVCDLSPENMQKLASAASATGVKVSMDENSAFSLANLFLRAEYSPDPPPAKCAEVPAPVGDKTE